MNSKIPWKREGMSEIGTAPISIGIPHVEYGVHFNGKFSWVLHIVLAAKRAFLVVLLHIV